jgi:caffeoyl-CoA O-methyltransferase
MPLTIIGDEVTAHMRSLLDRHDDPVLVAMERQAEEHRFPIVGRHVGVAYWFARAAGPLGEVHCSDGDPHNERKAAKYLCDNVLWSGHVAEDPPTERPGF